MSYAIAAFLVLIATETARTGKLQQYQESGVEVSAEGEGGGATTSSTMDQWDIKDAEEMSKKIEKSVEAQPVDKNWKEQVAGEENIMVEVRFKKSMEGILRIELSDRLIEKDVNVNVAAQILKDVAQKSRFAYSSLDHRSFPVIVDKLKDKKDYTYFNHSTPCPFSH